MTPSPETARPPETYPLGYDVVVQQNHRVSQQNH